MNGLIWRPVADALNWITSFKGFFISLFVYGLIELALYRRNLSVHRNVRRDRN